MTVEIDRTHDASLTSWVASANEEGTGFPIQNLPFGTFRRSGGEPRVGVAIGDRVLDLRSLAERELLGDLDGAVPTACRAPLLNDLMALRAESRRALRVRLSELLSNEEERAAVEPCLVPMSEAQMQLPARVGDYTDFYASVHHATNVGRLFRPDEPLLPNYKWVPIGYHGRASSVVVSGHPVRRPLGQRRPSGPADAPSVGASQLLDYEVEVGVFVGPGNELGTPVPVARAEEHIFGVCLLNDWSARDIQAWEYQPLGPFLSKSFASTVSPWVVTLEALAPFRVAQPERASGDPAPLPYLSNGVDFRTAAVDLVVEAWIETEKMRGAGAPPVRLSRGTARDLYWTFAQMLAHHASNGCNLRPGDLFGSGTVSGPSKDAFGCLLEITRRGQEPLELPGGEARTFLEDGDEVVLRGYCEREGFRRIGLGECRGRVLPAPTG